MAVQISRNNSNQSLGEPRFGSDLHAEQPARIKPPKDEVEKKESEALSGQIEDGQEESQEDDDGNWKRRKNIKDDNGAEDLEDKK